MSDQQKEPGELTDRFQAFAQTADPNPSRALPYALIAIGASLVVLFLAVIVVLTQ